MAHDGTGAGWDETAPAGTDPKSSGDDEIRDLRKGLRIRLEYEHTTPAASSVGGVHKEGSARAYYQATNPTNRPDGATALGTSDDGRLFVDSDDSILYHWSGTAWVATKADVPAGSIATADIANDAVDKDKIAADVAGSGLGQNADGSLEVKVDASSIEISSDTLRVKAAGVTAAMLAQAAKIEIAIFNHEQASGTGGDDAVADTWTKLTLNQTKKSQSWASLASSVVTLDAGTYLVIGFCPLYDVTLGKTRLYNNTGAAIAINGGSMGGAGNASPSSVLIGIVTPAGSTAYQFEGRVNQTQTDGFGVATSTGDTEVYNQLIIARLA